MNYIFFLRMSVAQVNLKNSNSSFIKRGKIIDKKLEQITDIYKAEEYVRSLPLSLTAKKELLNNNYKIQELRMKERKYNDTFHLKSPYKNLVSSFQSTKSFFNPFKGRIVSVEKNLGLDAASYFNLNSWFIYHNAITFALIMGPFLYIPQIVMLSSYQYQPDIIIPNNETMAKLTVNGSCYDYSFDFRPIDLLTGEVGNFFPKSNSYAKLNNIFKFKNALNLIFYGCFGGSIGFDDISFDYSMEYAYLFTMIVFFIYWLASIASK